MSDVIRFYRSVGKYGFLSNLYKCTVTFEGNDFESAEHAYQYGKPNKEVLRSYIGLAPFPRIAALIGHNLSVYDQRLDWNKIKVQRMYEVVQAKFRQNPDLYRRLKDTGDSTLVEDSKTDKFWGTGKKGDGYNTLGLILMLIRGDLDASFLEASGGED